MSTHRRVRQVVVQNATESISVVALDATGEPLTLTSATVTIYDVGGGELVATTPADVSASPVCSYTRTWSESSFEDENGFRARWVFNHAGGSKTQDTFFDVVIRRFESQLLDSDITARHPRLANLLPSGISTFNVWRMEAWRRIEQELRRAFQGNPGRAFYPTKFFDSHLDLTVAEFLRDVAEFAVGGVDGLHADYFEKRGLKRLELALTDIAVDVDDDNELADREDNWSLSGVELFR